MVISELFSNILPKGLHCNGRHAIRNWKEFGAVWRVALKKSGHFSAVGSLRSGEGLLFWTACYFY